MINPTVKHRRFNLSKLVTVVLIYAFGIFSGVMVWRYGPAWGLSLPMGTPVMSQPANRSVNFATFWRVWQLLDDYYLMPEDLKTPDMMEGAVMGMVAAVGDPYTTYIPPEPQKIANGNLAGAFYGIGVQLGYKDKMLAVIAPIADGPAAKQGVQAQDLIVHVRDQQKDIDEDSLDWSLEQALSALRGEQGSLVEVTFFREGYNDNQPFTLTFTREEIKVDSLLFEWKQVGQKKIAYLGVSLFSERTNEEWNQAVDQIVAEKSQVAGVILDLRNNPGGFVTEAIHIASEFIGQGTVLIEQGRADKHYYPVTGRGRLINMPLVVLVNKGSASSSEIVAGALRDRLGAKIVGSQTFGKGKVQQRFELANGAGLNITVNKWLTPNGTWLDGEGLKPDVEVEDNYANSLEEDAIYQAGIKLL